MRKSENIFIAIFSSTLNAEQNLRVLSLRNNQFRPRLAKRRNEINRVRGKFGRNRNRNNG